MTFRGAGPRLRALFLACVWQEANTAEAARAACYTFSGGLEGERRMGAHLGAGAAGGWVGWLLARSRRRRRRRRRRMWRRCPMPPGQPTNDCTTSAPTFCIFLQTSASWRTQCQSCTPGRAGRWAPPAWVAPQRRRWTRCSVWRCLAQSKGRGGGCKAACGHLGGSGCASAARF